MLEMVRSLWTMSQAGGSTAKRQSDQLINFLRHRRMRPDKISAAPSDPNERAPRAPSSVTAPLTGGFKFHFHHGALLGKSRLPP